MNECISKAVSEAVENNLIIIACLVCKDNKCDY